MTLARFLLTFVLTFFFSVAVLIAYDAAAAGIEYSGTTKPVRCTHPTTNVDGTALLPVLKAIVYVGQTPGDTSNYDLRIDIPDGCQAGITMDISSLTQGTQYYTYGELVTAGGTADVSDSVPFLRALPRPNPLLMLE